MKNLGCHRLPYHALFSQYKHRFGGHIPRIMMIINTPAFFLPAASARWAPTSARSWSAGATSSPSSITSRPGPILIRRRLIS